MQEFVPGPNTFGPIQMGKDDRKQEISFSQSAKGRGNQSLMTTINNNDHQDQISEEERMFQLAW